MRFQKGQPHNTQWVVQEQPEALIQAVIGAARRCGLPGDRYSFAPTGPTSVMLTRKYRPAAGWIGWFAVTLVFAPFLVYKKTETLTVTATRGPDGTTVDFAGTASTELVRRLNQLLSGLPRTPAPTPPHPPPDSTTVNNDQAHDSGR
jgi:hypothetical protein